MRCVCERMSDRSDRGATMMTKSNKYDIIIVGAGPDGSITAKQRALRNLSLESIYNRMSDGSQPRSKVHEYMPLMAPVLSYRKMFRARRSDTRLNASYLTARLPARQPLPEQRYASRPGRQE
jgi:hypothetical protein